MADARPRLHATMQPPGAADFEYSLDFATYRGTRSCFQRLRVFLRFLLSDSCHRPKRCHRLQLFSTRRSLTLQFEAWHKGCCQMKQTIFEALAFCCSSVLGLLVRNPESAVLSLQLLQVGSVLVHPSKCNGGDENHMLQALQPIILKLTLFIHVTVSRNNRVTSTRYETTEHKNTQHGTKFQLPTVHVDNTQHDPERIRVHWAHVIGYD